MQRNSEADQAWNLESSTHTESVEQTSEVEETSLETSLVPRIHLTGWSCTSSLPFVPYDLAPNPDSAEFRLPPSWPWASCDPGEFAPARLPKPRTCCKPNAPLSTPESPVSHDSLWVVVDDDCQVGFNEWKFAILETSNRALATPPKETC